MDPIGGSITLWDPLSNALLHTLSQPLPSLHDELNFVAFAGEGGALAAGLRAACCVLRAGKHCASRSQDTVHTVQYCTPNTAHCALHTTTHRSLPIGGALLAHSNSAVFCWDLLTGGLCWSYRAAQIISAAADTSSDSLLVAVALAPPAESAEGTANRLVLTDHH